MASTAARLVDRSLRLSEGRYIASRETRPKGAKLRRAIVDSNVELDPEKIQAQLRESEDQSQILVFGQEKTEQEFRSDSENFRIAGKS